MLCPKAHIIVFSIGKNLLKPELPKADGVILQI